MRRLSPLLPVFVFAFIAPAAAQEISDDTLYKRTTEVFRRALKIAEEDPKGANALYDEAIAGFEELARRGRRNGHLYRNLGNAYTLRGDIGRAILSYRRAEVYRPADPMLQASLAAARSQVRIAVEPSRSEGLLSTLLFWHSELAPRQRFAGFLTALAILGASLLLQVCKKLPRRLGFIRGLSLLIALVLLASLIVEEVEDGRRRDGVVIEEVLGLKGPGRGAYRPSFDEPLAPGVEWTAAEERGDWLRVRLRDGRETWIPRSAGAMVREP